MADGQQFSLRWNNYLSHITGAFDLLRAEESLVDVTLCCEGRRIKAHKMLLSACSSYFREIFKENPCQHPVIIFRNVKFEDLQAIINFMYQGEVNVAQEALTSFLNTAELLEVQGLTSGASREINALTSEDVEAPETSDTRQCKKLSQQGSSPCPESPPNKKKKLQQSPPALGIVDQCDLKSEPECYNDDSAEIYEDPNSYEIKQEPTEKAYSGGPSDDSIEGLSAIDRSAGTSNDGALHDSLQEDTKLEARKFKCTICGKSYKHQSNLSAHKRVHRDPLSPAAPPSTEGRFECRDCGKSYKHQSNLSSHRRTSHPGSTALSRGKKFSCQKCGKRFKHPSNLSTHKMTHTGRTKCRVCHKILSSKMALIMHLNAIHQIKP